MRTALQRRFAKPSRDIRHHVTYVTATCSEPLYVVIKWPVRVWMLPELERILRNVLKDETATILEMHS